MGADEDIDDDGAVKGEKGGDGTQRALGFLEFLTQDAEPSGSYR